MELSITILKDKDKNRLLDGSGIALEATTLDPITRIGADQEIAHYLNHVFPLEMITQWIHPPLSAKPQMTKNARNTEKPVNASNAGNKATLFAIVPIKRHMLVQLTLFKSKMTTNRSSLKLLLHLHLSLRE